MVDAIVGLADAIEALRTELVSVAVDTQDKRLSFTVEPIELTVQAVVTRDADGRIGWSVLGLGGSYSTGHTQTLTLRLTPLWRNSDGSLVNDFAIADRERRGQTFGPDPT